MAISMAKVARDHHPDVGILTNDPITGIGEWQFEATDAIVSAVDVDVIGVNYYPPPPARRWGSPDADVASVPQADNGVGDELAGTTVIPSIIEDTPDCTREAGSGTCSIKWRWRGSTVRSSRVCAGTRSSTARRGIRHTRPAVGATDSSDVTCPSILRCPLS